MLNLNFTDSSLSHVVVNLILCTVNFGFSDKSLITTLFFSPEISSSILYIPYFGYNDMLDNNTLNITTLFLYLMRPNHIGYYDFGAHFWARGARAPPMKGGTNKNFSISVFWHITHSRNM